MGTTAEKLTYLNGTKRLLRRRLNSLGANITLDTRFRDYLVWLDRFYNAASSSVNFEILGETTQEQYTSPNLLPNNVQSQTINGVTITRNDDSSLVLNGTANDSITISIYDNLELEAGTYYFNFYDTTTPTYFHCSFENNSISHTVDRNKSITFANNITGNVNLIIPVTVAVNNLVVHPMITEGSTAQPYEPYGTKPSPTIPSEIINKTGNIIYTASDGTEFPVSLGDIELCGNPVPNGPPDRLFYSQGMFLIEQNISSSVYDGASESWYYDSTADVYRGVLNGDWHYTPSNYGISNYFKNVVDSSIVDETTAGANLKNGEFAISYHSSGADDTFYLKYTDLDEEDPMETTAKLREWLSTHNTIIQFEINGPDYILITPEEYPTLYAQLQTIIDYETKLQIEKKIF